MKIHIHLQGVDTLFEPFHMIGTILNLATQVDGRRDTVAQETMYIPFHNNRAFRQCLVPVLEISIGDEMKQVVHIGYLKPDFHIDPGLFQQGQAADGTVGGERQVVYQQLGIIQGDCVEVVREQELTFQFQCQFIL